MRRLSSRGKGEGEEGRGSMVIEYPLHEVRGRVFHHTVCLVLYQLCLEVRKPHPIMSKPHPPVFKSHPFLYRTPQHMCWGPRHAHAASGDHSH